MARTFKDSDNARKSAIAGRSTAQEIADNANASLTTSKAAVVAATTAEAADLKAIGGKAVLPNGDGTFTAFVVDGTKPEGFAVDTFADGTTVVIPEATPATPAA